MKEISIHILCLAAHLNILLVHMSDTAFMRSHEPFIQIDLTDQQYAQVTHPSNQSRMFHLAVCVRIHFAISIHSGSTFYLFSTCNYDNY